MLSSLNQHKGWGWEKGDSRDDYKCVKNKTPVLGNHHSLTVKSVQLFLESKLNYTFTSFMTMERLIKYYLIWPLTISIT